jgi:hypothetical protein
MNLNEYLTLAEKTLSTQFNCDEKMQRVLHSVIGLATEIEELLINYTNSIDSINILEEIGDIEWYRSILWREYPELSKYTLNVVEKINDPYKTILEINVVILKLQDMIKKKIFYNKEINDELLINLSLELEKKIYQYIIFYNLNIEDVWERNIAKLKARYSEKFSSERAINRDLETERTILEGGK